MTKTNKTRKITANQHALSQIPERAIFGERYMIDCGPFQLSTMLKAFRALGYKTSSPKDEPNAYFIY